MATKENEKKTPDADDVLATAKKRFDLAVEAESEIRTEALDDLRFRAGEQWDEEVKQARSMDRRPCLTINRLPQFVRHVTNDQRQNRPSVKVNPVDEQGDVDTAKVLQGLIRHIEYNSNADTAYDTAFEAAVNHGFGYFRLVTDYADPMSFEQEILIKRVKNPFSVYLDPHYQEPDGSDANWGFVFEDISHDDYCGMYGESKLASMNDWSSIGSQAPGWASKETCRIAEYFYKEFTNVTLVQLSSGQVLDKSQLPELPEGITVTAEREARVSQVKWLKINAVEILEETVWPGKFIPIVPVLGDELNIEGRRILEGVIRHAKDPQRMYNYWASNETETIALAPRAPFIGVEGQFEGHEASWKSANTKNHAYLEYKPKSIGGMPAGPPQRQVFEPAVQAITNARMQSAEDLKATTGIYDSSLGAKSNENSGIAIQRRNVQAQTSNFHYIDNLTRALRHLGRILLDLIPQVYDTARAVRIIGEEGDQEVVKINQVFEKNGEQKAHILALGKYDVTVSTGPSFQTKRQEAVESMLSLVQSYPQVAQVAGDLMVKNMDWPGAQEIAERLKKTLPPGLVEDKDAKTPPIPPQAQQQIQQMSQLIEQMTHHLNEANAKIENKTLELESTERIEFAKMEVDLKKAMAAIDSKEAMLAFEQELSHIHNRLSLLNIGQPIEQENEEQGAGPSGAMASQEQPPTGGPSPGQPMGV